MSKPLFLVALAALVVTGCGSTSCEDYVEAALACYEDAGHDAPETIELDTICGSDDDVVTDEVYGCWARVYESGDCSDDGIAEVHALLDDCSAQDDVE